MKMVRAALYKSAYLMHHLLGTSADKMPESTAVICGGRRTTYAQLWTWVQNMAVSLRNGGILPGERVTIALENGLDTVIAFWGALLADAVVVVLAPHNGVSHVAHCVGDCEAAALVTTPKLLRDIADATGAWVPRLVYACAGRAALTEDPEACVARRTSAVTPLMMRRCEPIDLDLAAIIYTSGSTGVPKGVMMSHRAMLAACTSINEYLRHAQDDVLLCVLPLSFDYGLYQMIMAASVGATLVLEDAFVLPQRILAAIAREHVTAFPGMPVIFEMLRRVGVPVDTDLSSVRYVTNTGVPLPLGDIDLLGQFFPDAEIFSMFGLTECKRCSYVPPSKLHAKPGSIGRAIPNMQLRLVDQHGDPVAAGQPGELVVRSAMVMSGYWGDPEATRRRLHVASDGGIELHTGDICRQDNDGYFYFVGREDDMLKSRGVKVWPAVIERTLRSIHGVRDAAIVARHDPSLGAVTTAYVCTVDNMTEAALRTACRNLLEPACVPVFFVILPSLPHTATGKVDRQSLRRLDGTGDAGHD